MTDYGKEGRQRFLRQCRGLWLLRAAYATVIGISWGIAVAMFVNLLTGGIWT